WIKVDERYPQINVKMQREDPNSVFSQYKALIRLRKTEDILTDGHYVRLDDAHPQVFAYARSNDRDTLVVVSNFIGEETEFVLPESHRALADSPAELLSGNMEEVPE